LAQRCFEGAITRHPQDLAFQKTPLRWRVSRAQRCQIVVDADAGSNGFRPSRR